MEGIAVVVGVLFCLASVPVDLDLPDIHPDETAEETYNRRFSLSNALETVERVRVALGAPDAMSVEERTIGCRNWVGTVQGTLLKQQFIISRLTYELAVKRHEDGEASLDEVGQAKEALEEQERLFREFWEEFYIAD